MNDLRQDLNPYRALAAGDDDILTAGPEPTLGDRFWANFQDAQRMNTLIGASKSATDVKAARRARAGYESFPAYEGLMEGAAAFAGQVAGTAATPETFVPVTLGGRLLGLAGREATALGARIFAGAVDGATVNAVTDLAVQGIDIASGVADEFDAERYAVGVLLGAGIGGGVGAAARGMEVLRARKPVSDGNPYADMAGDAPPAEPDTPPAATAAQPAAAAPDEAAAPVPEPVVPEAGATAADDVSQGSAEPPELPGDAEDIPFPGDMDFPVANEQTPTLGELLADKAAAASGTAPWPQTQQRRILKTIAPTSPKPVSRPVSLTRFIARNGGLEPVSELFAMDADKFRMVGERKLVRDGGRSLDYAREAAAEAGYFPQYGTPEEAVARSTPSDLLDALSREFGGDPVYSIQDMENVAAWGDYEAAQAKRTEARQKIDEMLSVAGAELPDETIIRALERVDEDGDVIAALERVLIQEYKEASGLPTLEKADGSEFPDIPFFDYGGRSAPQRQPAAAGGGGRSGAGRGTGGADGGSVRSAGETQGSAVGEFLNLGRRAGLSNAPARDAAGVGAAAAKAEQSIQRVRETAEGLAKVLGVHATRQGRIRGRKEVLGQYGTKTGVVRVRSLEDFDVLSHEYGHHIDAHVPAVKDFIKRNSAVLKALDYDPVAGRDFEGFAEFFRLWLTNRAYAEKTLPKLAADFAKVLATKPEIRDGIDAAARAYADFLNAPSTAAVKATIASSRKPTLPERIAKGYRELGVAGTIHEWIETAYTWLFDDLNPVNAMVRHLDDLHLQNTGQRLDIKTIDNPYRLARMSRGAYGAGHMDVMHGVSGYRGLNPETPSLRDAIVEAMEQPNGLSRWDNDKAVDFGSYLWSRRALGEWARFEAGDIPNPPDKLTKGDHEVNIREMEAANPQFASAATKVHMWARGLWKKKYDAGLITKELYEEGLRIKDYVPGLRDFSADTDAKVAGKSQGRGGSMKGGLVKRFRGSKRDVINPLESLMADAYETAMTIARNDVVKSIDRLARLAGPGSGRFAEPVRASELKAMNVDPLEALENAAKNAGLSRADITVIRDAVESAIGDQKAAIFRPAIINERGEPIVFWRDGGELRALRLADGKFGKEVYQALTNMSQMQRNWLVDFLAMPARILRVGITAAPEFIMANLIRDQTMAWVYYGSPLKRLKNTALGGVDDAMGRETAKIYNRSYGITGGQEMASLTGTMVERDLNLLRRKGWKAQRLTSWRGILGITEFSETATRVGLFRTFADEARKRGLSEIEAAYEASYRARDYIDFDRRGAGIGWVAKIVPFFNVALQGLDKTGRQMLLPIAKKMLGRPMTAEDAAALPVAVQGMFRLGVLVAVNLAIYAVMSRREGHDEISTYSRSTHTMIKAGEKWAAVPKPFEFAVAMNLAEAGFDAMAQRDPRAAERWLDSLALTLAPPSLIEGNPAIATWFELRTNKSLFTGAPIVPDALAGLEPWLQYTARTSELSKQFGEWFGISPAVSDHIIGNMTGSLGKGALSLYDMAQPDAPTAGWDDAPITRRFIKDASRGSQSVTRFWELAGESQGRLTGAYKSWRVLVESGDAAGAADYYARLGEVEKAYVATSALEADARRLHPLNRARNAVQAVGRIRRDMAGGLLRGRDGDLIDVPGAARGAADDILSSLAMATTRNALIASGVRGWAQKAEIAEDGFYRELEALAPEVAQALADAYATSKVWDWQAVKTAWPDLRARALADGSAAMTEDLVAVTEAAGLALPQGIRQKRAGRPDLVLD
jgi:hypothetical protein